jgi:hypothetical protein
MMLDVDVRRLAAIDMSGSRGTTRRRRVVVAEFVSGAIGTTALGIWLLASSSSLGGQALAVWVLGAGLNYAPLAAHAIALIRPGRLDAELAGVDTDRELRRSPWLCSRYVMQSRGMHRVLPRGIVLLYEIPVADLRDLGCEQGGTCFIGEVFEALAACDAAVQLA